MSDPVTNVEIEDVLSSIRRLVSDGDKARTRDPAPDVAQEETVATAPDEASETTESMSNGSKSDRFVLTPAFMVVDNNASPEADEPATDDHANDESGIEEDEDAGWVEEISADHVVEADNHQDDESEETDEHDDTNDNDTNDNSSQDNAQSEANGTAPLSLTDMVWDSVEDARKAGIAAVPDTAVEADTPETDMPENSTPDRASLVATIAELEAAVGTDADDYEPDGSEVADDVMGETIAWPGAVARSSDDIPDAEEAGETQPASDFEAEVDDIPLSFEHRETNVQPTEPVEKSATEAPASQDHYGDDDLDGLLEAGGVSLDEDALRALVSEVVREELTGPLGERITRNVRKLVRREIHRILSSQEFD